MKHEWQGTQENPDEAAWRELDAERGAYINRIGDILGQVGEDSLEDTATSVMQQLADSQKQNVMLREALKNTIISSEQDKFAKIAVWRIKEALAATADLDKYVLCEKEPSIETAASGKPYVVGEAPPQTYFYRAKEQGK